MTRIAGFLKLLLINFMIFSALLVFFEITGQIFYKIKHGRFLFSLNDKKTRNNYGDLFKVHPYLAGSLKSNAIISKDVKTIKTTEYGTRITGAASNDKELIRVAILGGSTAFGTGVSDEESWAYLLQKKLGKKYAVINYGVPGYSTAEAIVQMAMIVPEKNPHIVLFYEGWNDIRNYHEKNTGSDYYGHGIRQFTNLRISNYINKSKYYDLKNIFIIAKFVDKVAKRLKKKKIIKYKTFAEPDKDIDRFYVRNLGTLKLLADKIKTTGIFIPQILNYELLKERKGASRWSRHIKNKDMPELMDRFNGLMADTCTEMKALCVHEELKKISWNKKDFVDDGHFSRTGMR